MAGSGGRTLAQTGQETFSLFKQVAAINQAPENSITTELWPKASFMAEADRFELWAINLGLFVPGHGSLDYRVREAESLCNTFQTFLGDLNDSLLEGHTLFNHLLWSKWSLIWTISTRILQ
jgi:hypothetical protein